MILLTNSAVPAGPPVPIENCAVIVSGLQVLSTTWKSTDGTRSRWKYVVDNVIVYRRVHREGFCQQ
jgi:hypothetical protein